MKLPAMEETSQSIDKVHVWMKNDPDVDFVVLHYSSLESSLLLYSFVRSQILIIVWPYQDRFYSQDSEYGRPFIIVREQDQKTRLKGQYLRRKIRRAENILRSSLGLKGIDKRLQDSIIAILTCPIEPQKPPKTKHKVDNDTVEKFETLRKQEHRYFDEMVQKCKVSVKFGLTA
ncbi:unnamed protein product [Cochlearia groenlandica]